MGGYQNFCCLCRYWELRHVTGVSWGDEGSYTCSAGGLRHVTGGNWGAEGPRRVSVSVRGISSCFLGSATALKPHTLGVRRKQLLACRYLVPMGSGLACTLPLFCLLLSGLPAVAASVVTALGRSACVCSRGAPLHYTSSCCDVRVRGVIRTAYVFHVRMCGGVNHGQKLLSSLLSRCCCLVVVVALLRVPCVVRSVVPAHRCHMLFQ